MTEKMYRIVWTDTIKAIKYLHKKGCFIVSDSIPANCTEPGFEVVNELMNRAIAFAEYIRNI